MVARQTSDDDAATEEAAPVTARQVKRLVALGRRLRHPVTAEPFFTLGSRRQLVDRRDTVIGYGNNSAALDAAISSFWGVGVLDGPQYKAEQLAKTEAANNELSGRHISPNCLLNRHSHCYGTDHMGHRCDCECHEKDHV